jgi:hypothetical protein
MLEGEHLNLESSQFIDDLDPEETLKAGGLFVGTEDAGVLRC